MAQHRGDLLMKHFLLSVPQVDVTDQHKASNDQKQDSRHGRCYSAIGGMLIKFGLAVCREIHDMSMAPTGKRWK